MIAVAAAATTITERSAMYPWRNFVWKKYFIYT
jgi:hypothetical protein